MKYGVERFSFSIDRDVWAEHFAEPGDIKTRYMLKYLGDTVDEDDNPRAMARRLRGYAKRLIQIANFLDKIGRKKNANTKTSKVPLQKNTQTQE